MSQAPFLSHLARRPNFFPLLFTVYVSFYQLLQTGRHIEQILFPGFLMHAFYWLLNAASPGFAGTGESRGLVPALGAAAGKIGPSG